MSLPTLLCMVKHSASVGHQVQHATWAGPRPAVVNGENGSCVVWSGYNRLTIKQTHILDTCIIMLLNEPSIWGTPVSGSSFYAELGDLLLCLYPPSLHGLCCCKPAQCRAPSDSQGYHPTSTATIYWYRSPLMSVENEIAFQYFSMQLFYTVNLLSTDRVDINIISWGGVKRYKKYHLPHIWSQMRF